MAITKTLVLSSALALILVISQVASQSSAPTSRAEDDLQYRPNNGNRSPAGVDTNIIDDNNNNNPSLQPGQFGNVPDFTNNGPQERPSRPLGFQSFLPSLPLFNSGFPGFGRGSLFGGMTDGFSSPSGGRPSIIDSVMNMINEQTKRFENVFNDLDRQAGEGEDVSYFNRNGVQYIRTCVTKRLTPEQPKPSPVPVQPSNILPIEDDKTNDLSEQKQLEPQQQTKPQAPLAPEQSDKLDKDTPTVPESAN